MASPKQAVCYYCNQPSAPCSIKSVLAHTVIPKEAHQQGKCVSTLQCTVQLSVQSHRPDTTLSRMEMKRLPIGLTPSTAKIERNIKKGWENHSRTDPYSSALSTIPYWFSLLSQVPQGKQLKTGTDNINSSKSHIQGPSNSGSKLTPEICPKQGNVFPCQYSLNNTVLTISCIR